MKPFKMDNRPHWYIKFMYKGKRRFVNTNETAERKASAVAYQCRTRWIEAFEAKCDLTFDQLVAWELERYSRKRKGETKHFESSLGLHWKRLAEFFESPQDCTYERIMDYIGWRHEQKRPDGSPAWTNGTLRKHLLTLRRGLKFARDLHGFTTLKIPTHWPELSDPDDTKGKRYASNEYAVWQIRDMIAMLQGHARDTALFLAATGLRSGEAAGIIMGHFQPSDEFEGCAGSLFIPGSYTDKGRTIAIPMPLFAIMRRALPFTIDHKRAFAKACERVTGSPKFGRRDFRAAFASALAETDPFGAHIQLGHSRRGVMDRYQNWSKNRMARVACLAYEAFAPGRPGDQLVDETGISGYERKRLKSESALYCVK